MSLHHITKREKIIVMLAVMSGLFLVALDQTIIATALGAIVTEFGSYSSIGFIVTAYMLTSTVSVPLAGKLSDMYGRRIVLLLGVTAFTLASLASGLANGLPMLIAARAIQGLGGGMILANAFTIVGDLFTPRERGKWQGMIGAVFGMSSVIGPLLGGWLTDGHNFFSLSTDWRWTFFINVPIGIAAATVIARFCPSIKHDSVHKPDYLGAVFITTALSALVLAVDNTETIFSGIISGGTSLATVKLTLWVIALVAGAIFVAIERKAAQPIIPLRFFSNKTYTLMVSSALLFGAAFMAAILYLTQFNQQVFGATASSAGLMLLPMVGGMMTSSIGTGQLVSRIGRYKRFLVTGFAIGTASVFALTTLDPTSPYWHEAVIMAFAGLGLGMAMPILNLAVQNEFEQKDLGAATASVQLFRGLGSTIGIAVLSGVLTAGILSSLGKPQDIPYIQTLQKAPQAAEMLKGDITADKLLLVNAQQDFIAKAAEKGLAASPAPAKVKQAQLETFKKQQAAFSNKVIYAFADSLRHVFIISGSLMAVAVVAVLFVPNRKLRSGNELGISE